MHLISFVEVPPRTFNVCVEGSSFNNTGSYTKTGSGTTDVQIAFNSAASGSVTVQSGTLRLSGGGTHSGALNIQGGTTLDFGAGTHNLNNGAGASSTGRLLISGATVNTAGTTLVSDGTLELASGTLNVGNTLNAASFTLNGGTLEGTGTLNVAGPMSWSSGTMTGAGVTNADGGLAITSTNVHDVHAGRVFNIAAGTTATWNNGGGGGNLGRIRTGGGSQINNAGTWVDETVGGTQIKRVYQCVCHV